MTQPVSMTKDKAETPEMKTNADEVPGPIRNVDPAKLFVHTSHALRLIRGRAWKDGVPGIVGLIQFGMLVQRICDAAREDDPYADWWLIQIAEKIADLKTEIESQVRHVETILRSRPGLNLDVGESVAPVGTPLLFRQASPYVYQAADVIIQFDWLVRAVQLCKRTALMKPKEADRFVDLTAHRIRGVFHFARDWRNFSVTRDDVKQNNQRAVQVKAAFGEIPADVVNGIWRDEFAPTIRKMQRVKKAAEAREINKAMVPTDEASFFINPSIKKARQNGVVDKVTEANG